MPIDLGTSPTGTPPTAEEKNQILFALGIADASTRSGAETLTNKTLASPVFAGVASGQLEIATQAATNATSAMTRSLMLIEPLFTIGQCTKPLVIPAFAASGTSATAAQFAGDRYVNLTSGTATSGYGRATLARGITTFSSFSGGGIDFSRKIGFSMRMAAIPNDPTGRLRVIMGGSGGVPRFADQDALITRGFGFEVANNSGLQQARTFAHNGTAYSTSAWVSINQVGSVLGVSSDGAGNIYLIYGSALSSRAIIASTQTGGPTSASGAGQYLDAVAVNATTGTTGSVTLAINDVTIYVDN